MAIWQMVGDLLEASGWTTVLAEAKVASAEVADSFLRMKRIMKVEGRAVKQSPTFMFSDQILHLEILVLIFVYMCPWTEKTLHRCCNNGNTGPMIFHP
jgi:hypothetical protein